MKERNLFRWLFIMFVIFFLFSSVTDGKSFGGGRGGSFGSGRGGGFKFGGSKGAGTFGKSSGYGSVMNKPRGGSGLGRNAMSFGAGALGGVAAYSLMRSMSSSYYHGPGYYNPGYGYGDTCVNNQDMNGTRFGSFKCPLNNFPINARYCCGEYGNQYCCTDTGTYGTRHSSNLGWIVLIIIICFLGIFLFAKHRRQQQNIIMIPVDPMNNEQIHPLYQPPPPPMGYPAPPSVNPYAMQSANFAPNQPPYPVHAQTMNPYLVKEAGPPAYEDVVHSSNQGIPSNKPN